MPLFIIDTNLPRSAVPDNFLVDATTLFQEQIGKPMKYITVRVNTDQMMTFAGTTDPCAHAAVASIGKISPEQNAGYAKALTEFICTRLGIDHERFYINFTDLQAANVSYTGKTFAEILGLK